MKNGALNKLVIFYCFFALIGCTESTQSNIDSKQNTQVLPYIGEMDFDYDDDGNVVDTIFHTIPEFQFVAHDSSVINSEFVKGKIYVADFFFTSCPSICPKMTRNMEALHNNTKDIDELILLSHTVDPKRDTLTQLNHYINTRHIDTRDDWFFLYASQEYVYEIGKYGYLINADVDPEAEGGFLHSEYFVLIDREGRIRGMYEGTDMNRVNQLEKDIRTLIKVEYGE